MAKKKEYIERVEVAATAVLGDEQVTNLLTERCGIARVDVEAIQTRIEPVRVGARHMSDSVQGLKQSTNDLKAKVTGIKRDLTSLRTTLNNNLKRKDPLFTKLGLNEARPGAQEPLLAYAEHAFTQGQNLSAAEGAVLTKHKWDHPRFTAALTQVLARPRLERSAGRLQGRIGGGDGGILRCHRCARRSLPALRQECAIETGRCARCAGDAGIERLHSHQTAAARAVGSTQEDDDQDNDVQNRISRGVASQSFELESASDTCLSRRVLLRNQVHE